MMASSSMDSVLRNFIREKMVKPRYCGGSVPRSSVSAVSTMASLTDLESRDSSSTIGEVDVRNLSSKRRRMDMDMDMDITGAAFQLNRNDEFISFTNDEVEKYDPDTETIRSLSRFVELHNGGNDDMIDSNDRDVDSTYIIPSQCQLPRSARSSVGIPNAPRLGPQEIDDDLLDDDFLMRPFQL